MTEVPNLYLFATKELAQDAALAYINKPTYSAADPSGCRARLRTGPSRRKPRSMHVGRPVCWQQPVCLGYKSTFK